MANVERTFDERGRKRCFIASQALADNRAMQTLRNAKSVARFVLVWFALTVGAAIASPLIHPQSFEMICSGSGVMKMLPKTDDGTAPMSGLTLDCPLCVALGAPPSVMGPAAAPHQVLSYALKATPAAHIAARTAAPPPARGPPVFS